MCIRDRYKLNVDRAEAQAMGISLSQINNTLAVAWGSSYVNDFVDRGRVKRVYVQGDAPFRMLPEDIGDWYVRNDAGEMVPFSAFASGEWIYGSPQLERYNGLSSMNIQGEAAPGFSTGEAMLAMEELASDLPEGITMSGPACRFRNSNPATRHLFSMRCRYWSCSLALSLIHI